MKVERGVAITYEDRINNTTSELIWIDGKKVEEAELVTTEEKNFGRDLDNLELNIEI